MRPINATHRAGAYRGVAAGVPAALVSSLTLLLSATPAHALPPDAASTSGEDHQRMLRHDAPMSDANTARAQGPAAALRAPADVAPTAYTVVDGDTISAIAAAHGLSIDAVLAANGLGWSSIIYPGEVLLIPAATSFELVADTTNVPDSTPVAAVTAAPAADLDAEQIGNVQIIIAIGRQLGIADRGIAIALGTAMQESWLRNLDWGDRDSLGLFQQRPSAGWGSEDEVRDAVRATRVFYGGPADPNGDDTRGLLDVAGWESMTFADAAQSVQISAFPERYAQWEQPAFEWLAAHG